MRLYPEDFNCVEQNLILVCNSIHLPYSYSIHLPTGMMGIVVFAHGLCVWVSTIRTMNKFQKN